MDESDATSYWMRRGDGELGEPLLSVLEREREERKRRESKGNSTYHKHIRCNQGINIPSAFFCAISTGGPTIGSTNEDVHIFLCEGQENQI